MNYPRLFTPITIRQMTLKNRIIMSAMHHLYTEDGRCTPRFSEYYYCKAEGGAGLVIVGSCRFDDYGAKLNSMSLRSDDLIPGWLKFTDGMHKRGGKVAVQLYHAGRYVPEKDVPCGRPALAPSAVFCPYTKETAPEMTVDQIHEVIFNYAEGAKRAKRAGFDAVEIMAASGYLIPQFLSPVTNLRTDEYGGSWENRCRFPLEVIRAVREAVGDEYPVIFRIGGNDFIPGSNTNEEAAAFAKLAEEAGVDLFNVTGGWHESRVPQITGDVPFAGLSYLGKGIKDAVSVPVSMANRMATPEVAEETLALGRSDLITMARALVADPEFPIKAQQGRSEEIRPCMGCNQGCLANTFFDKPIECLVNGRCGRELEFPLVKTDRPKRLLVVGGGPAGCEVALRAAERGHSVTLWEKTERLGGQMNLAAKVPAREDFLRLIAYYKTMLPRVGVSVEFSKEATPRLIAQGGFDEVILAGGGKSSVFALPVQADCVPVYTSEQVLSGEIIPGNNVAIIGGNYMGCQLAELLARRGSISAEQLFHLSVFHAETPEKIKSLLGHSDRTVSIVEQRAKIGAGFESGTAWPVLSELKRLGVAQYFRTTVQSITAKGLICEQRDFAANSSEVFIPCDCVVLIQGSHADSDLGSALEELGIPARRIGNSLRIGKAMGAIQQGTELGCTI
ncbi:MAG: hypothetical protein H6Q60_920 [Oscillospiraceae bacterium]|nr:hypothetical protein [Oscillospiraceae bacterium]